MDKGRQDGRQNRSYCFSFEYRSRRARYLCGSVKSNFSGNRERRCFFEFMVMVIKQVMVTLGSEEVDWADAGHTVVRCIERQNERYNAPRDSRWRNGSDTGGGNSSSGGTGNGGNPYFSRGKSRSKRCRANSLAVGN